MDSPITVVEAPCGHCRYPCHLSGMSHCDASEYMAMWNDDAIAKPSDFDATATAEAIDVAVVSLGGRANGRWKADNQDTFLLRQLNLDSACATHAPWTGSDPFQPIIVGVFDGHGRLGKQVATLVRDAISRAIDDSRSATCDGMMTAAAHEEWLSGCFASAAAVVDTAAADFSRSGAAAVVCAVHQDRVTAAWAGDSRAVLGLHAPGSDGERAVRVVVPLTRDHKPDPAACPSESERILAAGGRVDRLATDIHGNPVGPFRVFLRNAWTPGLALSRAFGDSIAREIGVVPTPDVNSLFLPRTIESLDRHVLIVASDGLWEWMSSEKAAHIAWEAATATDAAEALAEASKREWAVRSRGRTCDDITIAVAFLPA